MKTVALFVGTRPEAIKMAPVAHALAADPDLRPVLISTGQHREMLRQVLDVFELEPDHELDVMRPDQTLGGLTARLVGRIDELLAERAPDLALVQGDTTTAFVGALGSFYRGVPVGHVEAGLRTGDLAAPFPEEANRRLVAPLARWHFPPTPAARENLLAEGADPARVLVTGNTVIDALHWELAKQDASGLADELRAKLAERIAPGYWRERYVLVTGHRRENFGRGFEEICDALSELAARFPDVRFVYPVHLNPNVQGPVHERLGMLPNVSLCPPLGYREFVALMRDCTLVLTDSGGIQEEAPGLAKPVLVMRDTTERPEGVDAGTVQLVGPRRERIVTEVTRLLTDELVYASMASAQNPYGDGHAASRIVEALRAELVGEPATV